jgi:hypothetical protein
MAVVISLPLLGMSGVASAKASKGCHKTHSCKGAGGTGSGTGGTPPLMTLQIDPNPLVETYHSDVLAIVQVETSPSLAGDTVTVNSPQLSSACGVAQYFSAASPVGLAVSFRNSIQLTLDNEGNATTVLDGRSCAPGQNLVEADLNVAPYYTALTTLDVEPPAVTTSGLYGYPTTSGTVSGGEVETGDSALPDSSVAYAVFYVETDPVYAEQTVQISSPQLVDRCNGGISVLGSTGFESFLGDRNSTATLDDDGNAVFIFIGGSCAAGSSVVTADVEAGTHATYTTTFNILPPQPTI